MIKESVCRIKREFSHHGKQEHHNKNRCRIYHFILHFFAYTVIYVFNTPISNNQVSYLDPVLQVIPQLYARSIDC
jgi:hypothetical protein